jgi:Protein of unknown function DUF262
MRLLPSDPDVGTIVGRIEGDDINLQPEFQRGEVWTRLKKQRLIDSILRDWHVPPIHVIENPNTRKQEVLDGQQRLVSIRDFVHGEFPVDGTLEPHDDEILALNGLRYAQLPREWQRRFNQFPIRVFKIVDFQASEPGELFFRLNQPTSLTSAEQRNAFFGPIREEIKGFVDELGKLGIDKDIFGFSNFRMAYDDVLSRTALAIERNTISEKITAQDLIELYRRDHGFTGGSLECLRESVGIFARARAKSSTFQKLNKATLFSWLIFVARFIRNDETQIEGVIPDFLGYFQQVRENALGPRLGEASKEEEYQARLVTVIYENRSVARVSDVASVILRDAAIWITYGRFARIARPHALPSRIKLDLVTQAFSREGQRYFDDESIARDLIEGGWGKLS